MSIYVGNLPKRVTRQELYEAFTQYGSVRRVSLSSNRINNQRAGYSFVIMETAAQEEAAIAALDKGLWYGCTIQVNKTKLRLA